MYCIYRYMHLCIYLYIFLTFYLRSICVSICASIYVSICLFSGLSISIFGYFSVSAFIYLRSICMYTNRYRDNINTHTETELSRTAEPRNFGKKIAIEFKSRSTNFLGNFVVESKSRSINFPENLPFSYNPTSPYIGEYWKFRPNFPENLGLLA